MRKTSGRATSSQRRAGFTARARRAPLTAAICLMMAVASGSTASTTLADGTSSSSPSATGVSLMSATTSVYVASSAHAAGNWYTAWVRIPTKIARASGRYYAEWECTLGGTVVAAGITFVGLTAPWAIAGILAGGSFTAGCEMGYPHKSYYFSGGVPWSTHTPCWVVFPRGNFKHRYTECFV